MDVLFTEIVSDCWKKLKKSALKVDDIFRNMVISSHVDDETCVATVVLRDVDEAEKKIFFFTDLRSQKVNNLQKDNRIAVLFYNGAEKTQLILKGNATIHNQDELTNSFWATLTDNGKMAYMAQPGPSSVISSPGNGLEYINADTLPAALATGYTNFAVIVISVKFMEYLQLCHNGNTRAGFNLVNNNWNGQWLVP